jgi:hypothetical protein
MAYKMETNGWGGPKEISYKIPGGGTDGSTNTGSTSNFTYGVEPPSGSTAAETASFEATNGFASDDCPVASGSWKADFSDASSEDPTVTVTGGSTATPDGCGKLTPNYLKIGIQGS